MPPKQRWRRPPGRWGVRPGSLQRRDGGGLIAAGSLRGYGSAAAASRRFCLAVSRPGCRLAVMGFQPLRSSPVRRRSLFHCGLFMSMVFAAAWSSVRDCGLCRLSGDGLMAGWFRRSSRRFAIRPRRRFDPCGLLRLRRRGLVAGSRQVARRIGQARCRFSSRRLPLVSSGQQASQPVWPQASPLRFSPQATLALAAGLVAEPGSLRLLQIPASGLQFLPTDPCASLRFSHCPRA